jgi:hypothetical protein
MEYPGCAGARIKNALSLTLSLKGEGTVRCDLVFPSQPANTAVSS